MQEPRVTMRTMYRRHHTVSPSNAYSIPPLELEVTHRPRQYEIVQKLCYPDHTERRARTEYVYKRRPRHWKSKKGYHTSGDVSGFGYDNDYLSDYRTRDNYKAARVRLYTHDSHDPYSCTCYPPVSSRTIPCMMYDGVRCPHPEHLYQPNLKNTSSNHALSSTTLYHAQHVSGKQDFFTYPWTVQTFRLSKPLEFGYKQGQVKPPSAVTAPPFALYSSKEDNSAKEKKSPPYSAPMKANFTPLISAKPSDRRLRRVDRRRLAAMPPLLETVEEDVSPFDSVSQVAPVRPFRRLDSLRLRSVDKPLMRRVESELRLNSRNKALSTPNPRPLLDTDGFPQTPTRIFRGEYVDPNDGRRYEYDIKYGKRALGGTRRRLTSI